ncbi:MAG: VanW family protein [Lachnospiraceae bacterium]|nr:VanW family protein [Lachnospiraceae bacterium]
MFKKKKSVVVLTATFAMIISMASVAMADSKICNGVYVDGIDIGGKTAAEAEQAINDYVDGLKSKKVCIEANDKTIETTVGALGYTAKENDYISEAMNIGTVGTVIQRYKDLKDVENGKKEYNLEFTYDKEKVKEFVDNNIEECNIKAKEPSMKPKSSINMSSGDIASQFNYSAGVTGKVVDSDDAISLVVEAMNSFSGEDISVEPKVTVDEPKYQVEQLKKMDARIGTFTTTFSTSQTDRCKNIANAASKVNGTVVYPGETFSILKKITPVTTANGYYEAGSYLNGKVVESVGGGICQVSTTLYNAVLKSELQIVKRNNHSMVVSYVDIAFDAMISSSSGSDFKFKNNTDCPIYIEGYAGGGSITFNIYGKETRASNRKIRFENEIIETIQPGEDVVTIDGTKSVDYKKVTQSAHTGYKSKLYKIVSVDGVDTEKIEINSSNYKAVPKYVTVGSIETTVPPEATADPNAPVNPDDIVVEPVAQAPAAENEVPLTAPETPAVNNEAAVQAQPVTP